MKFHFKTKQGIKNFTDEEAVRMRGEDPDFAQRDLVEAIDRGDFPKWTLKLQIMTEEQAKTYPVNPFDLTKVWPHKDFPLIEVGELELNRIPNNYFADVEQSAFAPAHVVDGILTHPIKCCRAGSFPILMHTGTDWEQIMSSCPLTDVHLPSIIMSATDRCGWMAMEEVPRITSQTASTI